ncbi:HAMP domain-containing histidine kinase [Candidatus Saccharibacteria bacterium]|nr:HAMP domain-containing histidine kinase [Candidatus Saccharibacteria bacterium]
MFTSATLKLTAWYLVIIIFISLLFSFIIFGLSTSEISSRLERLQIRVEGSSRTVTLPGPLTLTDIRKNQTEEARASIFIGLLYMNLAVIGLGGVGSFVLARATLRPIEEAHEYQSRFTSDASHELRTPLAVMKSEIEVTLKDESTSNQEYVALLKSNLEEVDKLTQLSQSLLELSRLDYGTIERYDRVDVARLVREATTRLNMANRISYDIPSQPVLLDANQPTLSELFLILLDNAQKYSTADSIVAVKIASNGRTCKITITNDGPGIEKSDLVRIFDRFYRAEPSRTTHEKASGYGLGLSLARKIALLHEGTISAASTPNKATTFTVHLPIIRKNR